VKYLNRVGRCPTLTTTPRLSSHFFLFLLFYSATLQAKPRPTGPPPYLSTTYLPAFLTSYLPHQSTYVQPERSRTLKPIHSIPPYPSHVLISTGTDPPPPPLNTPTHLPTYPYLPTYSYLPIYPYLPTNLPIPTYLIYITRKHLRIHTPAGKTVQHTLYDIIQAAF